MWQRFSEEARRAIYYAQEEAQNLQTGTISSEHLLLGLLREGETRAIHLFWELRLDPVDVRKRIEKDAFRGTQRSFEEMCLAPIAKRAIDAAYNEARRLGDDHIGTEHLLLGLLSEQSGLAGKILKRLGATLEKAREKAKDLQGADESSKEVGSQEGHQGHGL